MANAAALMHTALLLVLALAPGLTGAGPRGGDAAPEPVTIAFIADQGLGPEARAVLQLIRAEGAAAVVHSGDLDYDDDPAAWEAQVDAVLGPDFPYFAAVGNHDKARWYGPGGYQQRLAGRARRAGATWTGDLGVRSVLRFGCIHIAMVAPDVFGPGDRDYAPYLDKVLGAGGACWEIASWHEVMGTMNVGGKGDDTGWGVYEAARRAGAIIVTGHEHTYSRTHLLASMERAVVADRGKTLQLAADDPATADDEGRSFVVVSGLGGAPIRAQRRDGDWWAAVYTSTQKAVPGALFATFGAGGDPARAEFRFRNIRGEVIDAFVVRAPPN